jgi:hypothetical protein
MPLQPLSPLCCIKKNPFAVIILACKPPHCCKFKVIIIIDKITGRCNHYCHRSSSLRVAIRMWVLWLNLNPLRGT